MDAAALRSLEVLVLFRHLAPGIDWDEMAWQAYQAHLRRQRERSRRWYARRRHLSLFRQERNERGQINKKKALAAEETRIREAQHRHQKNWYSKLKKDPVRYKAWRKAQNARARKRRQKRK